MVKAQSKDGTERILVYQNSVLLIDKEDIITFLVENEHLKFKFLFSFSNQGDKFTTDYWESAEEGYLHYQLNNWDSLNWVEISKPFPIKVKDEKWNYWLKFRSESRENQSHRRFDITIWKEVKHVN